MAGRCASGVYAAHRGVATGGSRGVVSIKGTLETFNLLDLLQMLSFNQKEGTLVLETGNGTRTLYVRRGQFGFVQGDPSPTRSLARVLRRTAAVAPARLERAIQIATNSSRFLGDALGELGAMEEDGLHATSVEAIQELFFDILQMSITRFEFVEGQGLAPSGVAGAPIMPMCAVDAVLIDLTRKLDEWSLLRHEVPSECEVYERTGREPDLRDLDRVPDYLPSRVLPLVDGRRSVADVIEESDGDRFSVLKLLSLVLRQGAIAAVATGDLQARGEELLHRRMARQAVPLLRRAVERGDALPSARMKLAEALEAAGDVQAAASEYDTYASGQEATDPAAAFEALHAAMGLRGHDAPTAARLCDLWMRDNERIPHRQSEALAALRVLVDAAGRGGSPAEAAERLARFLDAGLAPSEDLLVLADLWAAAGRPNEAATALVRRADLLLREGRTSAARELMRRALLYDATRLDVRRRADELDRQHRERRSKHRSVLVLCVLGLAIGSGGIAWFVHDGRAARAAETAIGRAESGVKGAETTIAEAIVAWQHAARLAEEAEGKTTDNSLGGAAGALRSATRRAVEQLNEELDSAATEIEDRSALGHASDGLDRVKALREQGVALAETTERAIAEVAARADEALLTGEHAFAEGRFGDAQAPLWKAIRLSLPGEGRRERARRNLDQVARYMEEFRAARGPFDAAVARSDTDGAWREAGRLYERFLDCDMTRALQVPVPVDVEPRGALARVGDAGAAAPTPTVIRYSPFGDVDLRLRAPGRVPLVVSLPSIADIREASPKGGLPPVRVRATLSVGPRWASPAHGVTAGPFATADGSWVVHEDGRRLAAVRSDGSLIEVTAPAAQDKVREAGRVADATWVLAGLRTFHVVSAGGAAWDHTMPGRLLHKPVFTGGLAVLADDTGVVRALDMATGAVRWEGTLPHAPAQTPVVSALGLVLALGTGEVVAIDPEKGTRRAVAPASGGRPAFVVPWNGEVLVVGGSHGLATHDGGGRVRDVGDAAPSAEAGIAHTTDGCAWVEADGTVRWLGRAAGKGPVVVTGAGKPSRAVALAGGWLYAVGTDRVLRGVRLDAPETTAWSVTLPAAVLEGPVVIADLVVLRTETSLIAYDR